MARPIVKACAYALRAHPAFNITIEGEQQTRHDQQHVCIAIALDDGLTHAIAYFRGSNGGAA